MRGPRASVVGRTVGRWEKSTPRRFDVLFPGGKDVNSLQSVSSAVVGDASCLVVVDAAGPGGCMKESQESGTTKGMVSMVASDREAMFTIAAVPLSGSASSWKGEETEDVQTSCFSAEVILRSSCEPVRGEVAVHFNTRFP